jgi:hypothetical protein
MTRPLKCLTCLILITAWLATNATLLTTICYSRTKSQANAIEVTLNRSTCEASATMIAICEQSAPDSSQRMSAVKSTLRAGVAVSKAVGRKALVVATSVARAARHAATAILQSAPDTV